MNDTWRVSIPGVPPSVNHMYQASIHKTATGSYRGVRKAEGVEAYQDGATMFVRTSMPSSWRKDLAKHEGYIRIKYWFYLQRDIDCDNALKALNDAIAKALGVDDKRFLPYVVDKWVSKKNLPRVELEFSFHTRAL
jgi:Holliday junction resolvase RusA-like endonuclease